MNPSIYEWAKGEESRFQTDEIRLGDNWSWNLRNHIQFIFHLKNSIFFTGENNWTRAFKAVMEPILNLSYWAEDIEVKDIIFFTEEENGRALSFLIKKYHDEVFVRENNLDTFLDEVTESDVDYGGVLVQKTNTPRPEVVDLQSIAFCDQTELLGGPIAFKSHFTPDSLRKMSKAGWGSKKNGATHTIDELIEYVDNTRQPAGMMGQKKNITTGKTIEVYIIRGSLPEHYLKDNNDMETYYDQLHIIAFYSVENGKQGCTLYRSKESESSLKFHTSKKVYGRAIGRGVGESLLHPQVWTNFLTTHKTRMLEASSKVPLYTDDPSYTQKNKILDMENLEITTIEDGKRIYQVPTAAPTNVALMDKAVNEWFEQGQLIGSAFDPILGKEPVSGTTFRGQERTVQQGRGLHERRRGQRAKFLEEIYRDWIIPYIRRQITSGKKFLASLSSDEMEYVMERVAVYETNTLIKEKILNGELISQEDIDTYTQTAIEQFRKKGTQHILEILKGEMAGIEFRVGINISSKQKDLAGMSDKILSIFQSAFANPVGFMETMKIPGMAKAFQDILEYGGLPQVDFSSLTLPSPAQQPITQAQQAQPV